MGSSPGPLPLSQARDRQGGSHRSPGLPQHAEPTRLHARTPARVYFDRGGAEVLARVRALPALPC